MKKLCIIGHFASGRPASDGQTVKTRTMWELFVSDYGADEVMEYDTTKSLLFFLLFPFRIFHSLFISSSILIMPCDRGIRVIPFFLTFFNVFFRRKLYYSVIGGWLPVFLEHRRALRRCLSSFDGIFVETETMKRKLLEMGFRNIYVVPNTKKLDILKEEELDFSPREPLALCTFSRVSREKGIEDAVEAVKSVNRNSGRVAFTLDIYGAVEKGQEEWFSSLESEFPDFIRYMGVAESGESVSILKSYFALLFPTLAYTEGVPGTIIDAYSAGVPVIASRWESSQDVIDDGRTGILYDFGSRDELTSLLSSVRDNPGLIISMKRNALEKANEYTPSSVLEKMKKAGLK